MATPMNAKQMSTAIRAANAAILKAQNTQEMLQGVCDAAVADNAILGAVAFLPDPASSWLDPVASSGELAHIFAKADASSDPAVPQGNGLVGEVFRTGEHGISEEVATDPRMQLWRPLTESAGAGKAAAFPFFIKGQPIGVVCYFFSRNSGELGAEMVEFLSRISDIVSLGMELTERDERRRSDEQARDRMARMLAALSATNEAMMRARTRAQLFEMVCEAAVLGGNFISTTILLAAPGDEFFHVEAAAGVDGERSKGIRVPIDTSGSAGRGLSATALLSKQPCVSNDYVAEIKTDFFQTQAKERHIASGAALPLLKDGDPVGVLLFLSREVGAFTPELIALLQRLAENVSFALLNFDRAAERKQAEERMEYLATHDGLTGLPNRVMFNHLLDASIRVGRRYERKFALLFIDLDKFKDINDTLGHAAGDALLVEVANRLRKCLRDSDVVARLGGDEFVVILSEVGESHRVAKVAANIVAALGLPLVLSGRECGVTASIGIALFPADGEDEESLTKHADIAMYNAKESGKNDFKFFSNEIKTQSVERLKLETNLRLAVDRNEFYLHYQPKLNVATGDITGVEALLRWKHPTLGELSPGQFIPLAEETGLIVQIGRWVLRTACQQSMEWHRRGLKMVSMAVNLSPRQFADANLLRDIDAALAESGLPPDRLQLEISESTVMLNVARAIELLDAIQGRGVRLAIADFGLGYSSMSVMKRFPIDTIKIDQSFMRDLPDVAEDKGVAEAIIGMGKALGLTVIAEGVETSDQEVFLRRHACDEIQGFLFSKAVSSEDLATLLQAQAPIPSPDLQPLDPEYPSVERRPKAAETSQHVEYSNQRASGF